MRRGSGVHEHGELGRDPPSRPRRWPEPARSLAGLTCLLFLALTTPATDLIAGLRRLGLPAEITEVALLMYRFLLLLADDPPYRETRTALIEGPPPESCEVVGAGTVALLAAGARDQTDQNAIGPPPADAPIRRPPPP